MERREGEEARRKGGKEVRGRQRSVCEEKKSSSKYVEKVRKEREQHGDRRR